MFRIRRRLLAVSVLAALALAAVSSVAAYEVYTNPSHQGCSTNGYAESWINAGDHIYNENTKTSCASRVAAKAWYQHPTDGWLQTQWHISSTVAYAEHHYVDASPYTKGSYQVEVGGGENWGSIIYSALLTPD